MWGGFLDDECDCADSIDLLHSSQQIAESLEVPERDLWLGHARCDACHWPLLADHRCLRLPGFVHLCGLHGTNMECLRATRPCSRFPIPGLPIPAGDLAFISFCGDFDFSRHTFPTKGQCLCLVLLMICFSCSWADMLQDSWWFGVPLLTRGPLIALPIVLATDYPAVQTVWVTFILLSFLACQAMAWPWKALSHQNLDWPSKLEVYDYWVNRRAVKRKSASIFFLRQQKIVGIKNIFHIKKTYLQGR